MVHAITSVAYAFAMAECRLNQPCISAAPWQAVPMSHHAVGSLHFLFPLSFFFC
jgi:hypothetical protein